MDETDRPLPPPPPDESALGRAEEQIRADERRRVERELDELAAGDHEQRHRDDRIADDRVADDRVVDDRVVDDRARPVRYEETERVVTRTFSVGQMVLLLVGALVTAWGVYALTKTGFSRAAGEGPSDVFGFAHVPAVAISELVAGVLLILAALRPGGRFLGLLVGIALIVVGVLIVAENTWMVDHLHTERDFGWVPIIAGALAVVASLLTPRRHTTVTERREVDRNGRPIDQTV